MAAPTTAAPAAAYEFSQPPAAVPAKRVPYREPVTAPTLYVGGTGLGEALVLAHCWCCMRLLAPSTCRRALMSAC